MTCRLCGGTVYEISFVPRVMEVKPNDNWGDDEAYWEGETIIGYGCGTDACPNWQGNYDLRLDETTGMYSVEQAPELEDIAVCGQDYMAGQICMLPTGHEGSHR